MSGFFLFCFVFHKKVDEPFAIFSGIETPCSFPFETSILFAMGVPTALLF